MLDSKECYLPKATDRTTGLIEAAKGNVVTIEQAARFAQQRFEQGKRDGMAQILEKLFSSDVGSEKTADVLNLLIRIVEAERTSENSNETTEQAIRAIKMLLKRMSQARLIDGWSIEEGFEEQESVHTKNWSLKGEVETGETGIVKEAGLKLGDDIQITKPLLKPKE